MRAREIEQLRHGLAGRREIKFAILYGSAADGDDYNDLDVAVYVDAALIPPPAQLHYGFELEAALRSVVAHPVDVRVINAAPLPFRFNVIKGIPLLIQDAEAYYQFRERSWADYLALEPLYRAYFRELL